MDTITTVGLDIAKNSFAVHGFDANGVTVLVKELKRGQVLAFFARLSPCRVGLEACASAHHWARELNALGHEARLIPAQRVKAFLPRQKNDAADAKAIARAARDPEMRFVPVKTGEQQSVLMLFKARDLLVSQRTRLMNALRGHFGEVGIVVPKGPQEVAALVAMVMDEKLGDEKLGDEKLGNGLPGLMRAALRPLVFALFTLNEQVAALGKAILGAHRASDVSRRLATVPGIGTLSAAVLTATVPDPSVFSGGREFAAWIGLVPRQDSTGGKPKLGRISKMGNRDLRRLLVLGAHAALYRIKTGKTKGALADWARALLAVKPFKLVAVALANKMARIAWALMAKGAAFNPAHMAASA
jgi:transposase